MNHHRPLGPRARALIYVVTRAEVEHGVTRETITRAFREFAAEDAVPSPEQLNKRLAQLHYRIEPTGDDYADLMEAA